MSEDSYEVQDMQRAKVWSQRHLQDISIKQHAQNERDIVRHIPSTNNFLNTVLLDKGWDVF